MMYVWPTVCYVDPEWAEKTGQQWRKFLYETLRESSAALRNAVNCMLAPLDVIEWPVQKFEESELRISWQKQKNGLRRYYSQCYGYTFNDKDLMGIFLLNHARIALIRFSRITPYAAQTTPPFLHLGFVGSLYWFHLSAHPPVIGGGMASITVPHVVVNYTSSRDKGVHAVTHEVLHLFGAHHDETGVMDPASSETVALNEENRIFVEKSMKDFFENGLPLPGKTRLFEQPPIHK